MPPEAKIKVRRYEKPGKHRQIKDQIGTATNVQRVRDAGRK
jgi:hypothetical protein